MSEEKGDNVNEQLHVDKNEDGKDNVLPVGPAAMNNNEDSLMPSAHDEEESVKKKYGGMLPKKAPLISKDHERAFFDSADWALGKQGVGKPKGPLEALRPKLQPTRQQQSRSRRSAYASADSEDGGSAASEDANSNQQL